MKYPIEKYTYDIHQHPEYLGVETIASSTYAGQPVSGKSICHIDDEYKEQKGIELAAARCAEKIARKRRIRAMKQFAEAQRQAEAAQKRLQDMAHYLADAENEVLETRRNIENILSSL